MNFTPVAFLDTFELAASLRTRMGLFGAGEPRILPVRGPRPNADDPDDDVAFVAYKDAAKWVELRSLLGRIQRLGTAIGGIEFGRIFLELLPAGARLPWVLDEGDYFTRYTRAHLALRTNPGAVVYSGPEMASLQIGWLTIVNQRMPTSAANFGEWPRVHLVVDSRKKDKT